MSEHPAFSFDWNLVRTFIAVAQMGSLAKGARSLGVTHPTAARHVQQLEESLGFTLFTRTSRGLVLNDAGQRLALAAEQMHRSALSFQAVSDGMSALPVARVRITTAEVLAELLSDLMVTEIDLQTDHNLAVDMVVTDEVLNLLQREADIALRHVRPDQQELLCRRVGTFGMGAFASRSYLRRYGRLNSDNVHRHRFIDGSTHPHVVRGAAKKGFVIDDDQVVFKSDSMACQRAAARAGWGIAAFPFALLDDAELVSLLPANEVIDMELWLAARPEVRENDQLMGLFSRLGDAVEARLRVRPRSVA